jgi:hypothetical protein
MRGKEKAPGPEELFKRGARSQQRAAPSGGNLGPPTEQRTQAIRFAGTAAARDDPKRSQPKSARESSTALSW